MSVTHWEQAYFDHTLWVHLDDLRGRLEDGPDRASEAEQNEWDRLHGLVDLALPLRERFSLLVSDQALANADAGVLQALSGVEQWANGGGEAALADAGRQMAAVGDQLRTFPIQRSEPEKGLVELIRGVTSESDRRLASLQSSVEDSTEAMEKQRVAVAKTVDTLERETTEFTNQVNAEKERIDAAVSAINSDFITAQTERSNAFETESKKRTTADEKRISLSEEKGAAYIARLEEMKDQAEKLVEAVGQRGTATEYGRYAEDETGFANNWSKAAVGSFLLSLVVFVVFTVLEFRLDKVEWEFSLTHLGGSIALIALGAFCARESAIHRAEAQEAKSKQLDLAAINPFIATLDEDEQKAIKGLAARRLFTTSKSLQPANSTGLDLTDLSTWSQIVAILQKLGVPAKLPPD